MINAIFAFFGTELVAVTAAEAQNPRKTIPKATRLTFYRIIFFYCLSVLFVGMLVPYNSTDLAFANTANTSAAASPFVVAAKLAGVPVIAHIINTCILFFVFSASNSDLYIASRTMYSLASTGNAPAIFRRTTRRGVPIYAVGISALFSLLAFMNVSSDSTVVFGYFVNVATILALLTWTSILVTHIYWMRARKAQNIPNSVLPYYSPFGLWGSYVAVFFCIILALTKNFDVFTGLTAAAPFGLTKYKTFITAYIGIPAYLILLFGHKLITKSKGVKPQEADFYTGKDIIDREEEEFLASKEAKRERDEASGKRGFGWFYRTFVQWLF
jgi:amino acid transporter